MELTGMERDNIVSTIKSANKKTSGLIRGIRKREQKLVEIIQTRSSDVHSGALIWLKDKAGAINSIKLKLKRSEDPSNEDIKHNIAYANLQITDKIEPLPQMFLTRWWNGLSQSMTATSSSGFDAP